MFFDERGHEGSSVVVALVAAVVFVLFMFAGAVALAQSQHADRVTNVADSPLPATVLLGRKLGELLQADYFTFFCLKEEARVATADGATTITFRPSGEKFHDLVKLEVRFDAQERSTSVELELARTFVDDPRQTVFARDIAKSLLLDSLTERDRKKMADLVNEIFHAHGQAVLVHSSQPQPRLPDPPTEAYQVFVGKVPRIDVRLRDAHLSLENRDDQGTAVLAIKIGPPPQDEKSGR